MKQILTKHGEVTALAKLFSTSTKTVQKALAGRYDSRLVRGIRKVAIERGGKETDINSKNNTI